jgi:uncharacterized repeat protein (TIGR01451 family)
MREQKKSTWTSRKSDLFLTMATLVVFAVASPLTADESPFLVKDINASGSSAPTEFVTVGDFTFFAADNGVNGVELWKTDGTAGGTVLVKDICPGSCGSAVSMLTAAGSTLFFVADDGSHGAELWKSNGTAAGTEMVRDLRAGNDSPVPSWLTAVGSTVFFSAHDGQTGTELWKSDGTFNGTVLVKDVEPGGFGSGPGPLVAVGNTLFFVATTSPYTRGRELWTSNGTEAGTFMVKDINPVDSSFPSELTAVGSLLFFSARDGKGYELWKSNGTTAGTARVKDINPAYLDSFPSELTDVDGTLFFLADDGSTGRELWKSDGTESGTVRVKDLVGGTGSPGANLLTAAGGVLLFAADDGWVGEELWRSNGTDAGTYLVRDINPGAPSTVFSQLAGIGGTLCFAADDGLHGNELWQSDGTFQGTDIVEDLVLGPSGSDPSEPSGGGSFVFFAADDGQTGRELWALPVGGPGGEPAVGFTKQFQDDSVLVGSGGHTFTLVVSNSGDAAAEQVRVTDLVDSRITVDNVSPASRCNASSGQSIDCLFPSLAPSASETVTVTYSVAASVPPVLGVLNQANASFSGGPSVAASDTVDLLGSCQGLPLELDLSPLTVTNDYLAEACVSISVGPDAHVMKNGDASFVAGDVVILTNDFVVESGGSLTVTISPMALP